MKLTIGLFTDSYHPSVGGTEVVVASLQRVLTERGHAVYIFAPKYPGYRDEDPQVLRVPSLLVQRKRGGRLAYRLNQAARSRARELQIVHCHTPWSLGWMGVRVARAYQLPVVYTHHCMVKEYRPVLTPYLPPHFLDWWFRAFLRHCEVVLAPSEDARREVESFGAHVPVVVLPCGLDVRDFERPPVWNPRVELGFDEPYVLLFVGRLGKEKNVDFLLHMFRHMLLYRRDVRLLIVGDGPEARSLQQLAITTGIADKTTWCGFLPREKLIDLYRVADLFVFASKTESQGLVILEAMMLGVVPVVVDALGVRRFIRSGTDGLLLPDNEEVFARRCLELLADHRERALLSAAARERAREFTIDATADRLIDIYERACQNRRSAEVRLAR